MPFGSSHETEWLVFHKVTRLETLAGEMRRSRLSGVPSQKSGSKIGL
jgi:hypothetical protein